MTPTRRRWADIKTRSICLALILASQIPPLVFNGSLILLAWRPDAGFLHLAVRQFLESVAIAALWWLFSGLTYAYVGRRRHRLIGRSECLLLGLIQALCYPPVSTLAKASIGWLRLGRDMDVAYLDWVASFSSVFFTAPTLAISLGVHTPIGIFAGWMLWRIAVRRAPVPIEIAAPLFD